MIGVADLINSIAAVKHLVYDTGQVQMSELVKALDDF
jgi:choline trimethylamine-lyase